MNKAQNKITKSARDYFPKRMTLPALRAAAKKCQGCHLYKDATQTVFGSGAKKSNLIVVGEIPGLKEDITGEPFMGPAGTFLKKTIANIGMELEDIYFTNVVKHFKFIYSKKRKLHRSPTGSEIKACVPWLETEIQIIQPKVILCLGATAAKSLVNKSFHIQEQRGRWLQFSGTIKLLVTFHPSAILRAPDHDAREAMKKLFTKDLKKVSLFLNNRQ